MKRVPALAAGVWVVALATPPARPAEAAGRHIVEMRDFGFSPSHLAVAAGDTIVWINRDIVAHTATDSMGRWDAGEVKSGRQWQRVARDAGEFAYLCAYHPSMRGTISVAASGAGVSADLAAARRDASVNRD